MKNGCAVIIEVNGLILLLRRSNIVTWSPGKWNLPTGTAERNEPPLQTAIRETKEETNLTVGDLQHLARLPTRVGFLDVFIAGTVHGELKLNAESCDYVWVPLQVAANYPLINPQREALLAYASLRE